jgi:hypothetical protein
VTAATGRRRASFGRALVALAATTLCAATLAACSSHAASTPVGAVGEDAARPIPLTSSSASTAATWATLAMGHLDDPLNTFWQVLRLSNPSGRWALATPAGVASNGGMVASVGSGSVITGFEPSQDLRFSPLARSADQGATWTPGVLPGGLAPTPDSLAAAVGDRYLALLRSGAGGVVSNTGDLTTWKSVASESSLAADPAASGCGVQGLTAISWTAGGDPLVGTRCAHGARVGIFELAGGHWRSVGPRVPGRTGGSTEVLRMVSTPAGLTALVRSGPLDTGALFAAWSSGAPTTWSVSTGLPLGRRTLMSTGTTATGGVVVTSRAPDGRPSASTVGSSVTGWQALATPPAGTSSVVPTPEGGFDALISDRSTLHVDSLGHQGWSPSQTLDVPIQYGSSG